MTIADNKVRVSIVIEKADKEKLDSMALKEERSINYLINKAIKEYLKKGVIH